MGRAGPTGRGGAFAGAVAPGGRHVRHRTAMATPKERSAEWLAFAAQALAHADALHNLARYLAATPADAEDLVQETYVHAFAAAARFAPGSNLKAWLFRILRNAFLSRLRHERRAPAMVDGAEAAEVPAGDAWLRDDFELEAMRGLVGEEIDAALRSLSEEARTTVLLDLEGLTEAEMAEVLGCAPGTVKSRLSRARAALRDQLVDYAPRDRP
jgi:RNA polymerase sigma-70 factor, ECF subfamily